MHCQMFQDSHCTSCGLLGLSYAEGLELKKRKLLNLMPEASSVLQETIVPASVEGSRGKVKLAVFNENGTIKFGFTETSGTSKELENCPLHIKSLNALLPELRSLLEKYKIEPYDIASKKGELKFIILSESTSHKDILVRFTLRSKESLDRLRKLAVEFHEINDRICTVTANLQPKHQAIFEGEEEFHLFGKPHIEYQYDDVTLFLGPRSFFQVTPEVAQKLYRTIGEIVHEKKLESFLDLYCGVGAFAFFAAKSAKRVLGIELSAEAIESAKAAIPSNAIAGAIDFKAVDVDAFLKTHPGDYQAIMTNPPRRGLNAASIETLMKAKPSTLFYSSCNVETLARDHELIKSEYKIESAQIFDMFPYTEHFETLIVYSHR